MHQNHSLGSADLAGGDGHRILLTRRFAGSGEAINIGFAVGEMQRIVRRGGRRQFFILAFIEGEGKAQGRADAHVASCRGHPKGGLQIRAIDHFTRVGTLDPEIFWGVTLGDQITDARGNLRQPAATLARGLTAVGGDDRRGVGTRWVFSLSHAHARTFGFK